jgi:hypothetical protein
MTHGFPRGFMVAFLAFAVGASFVSCKTGKDDKLKPAPVIVKEFIPATFIAGIQAQEGPYPNLFAPDSYAVWVGSDVTRLRAQNALKRGESLDPRMDAALARINENYLVFECNLASIMPDMSIAYDAVGMRGMNVYLMSPDGRKTPPVQTSIGSTAGEELRGALRRYSRTNVLVFEKKDLWFDKAAVKMDAPSARLVIEGLGTTFRFEWPTALAPNEPWIPNQDEYVKAIKVGFKETCKRIGDIFHTLD